MRIITGKAKGINIKTLEGEATRPTSQRVKEAVFSMLQFDIEGRRVLDLFSGSGQMALEAISRGASFAVMVDRAPEAIKIINDNVIKTKFISQCEIRKEDYLSFLSRYRGEKFDIIFLDPPYASGFYAPALKKLLERDIIKSTSLIICESDNVEIFGNDNTLAGRFDVIKQTGYGRICITILSPKKENSNEL
ncbi:MAG: 16S rRNA (guanine(966)-N(2))-methyltransferase RsmD [Clostridia bacterium]|nr:16S rRNA (guanine(966)-N(2))-methyltransferase RsmD [Clostridia bacterium]